MLLNLGVGLAVPEAYLPTFTLLVVTEHELPEHLVQRFVLERILRGRDTKRNMIGTRKGPRVANPSGQERHHGRRGAVGRQRGAITKSDFHVRRLQWPSELFRDAAVGAICCYQER